jgi:hypothetical protein
MTRTLADILQALIFTLIIFPLYINPIFAEGGNDNDVMYSISNVKNISNDKGQSRNPQLAVYDTNVYVAWHNEFYIETLDTQSYEQNILFAKGSDYGKSFNNVISLADNNAAGGIRPVRLVASDTSVYVAWNNGSSISDQGALTSNEIFLRSSAARGEQPFSRPALLSDKNVNYNTVVEPPELAAWENFAYTVWSANNLEDGNTALFFKRSTDSGDTFKQTVNLTTEDGLSKASVVGRTINADANQIDVIWTGYNGTGDKGVFLKRSLDYGESFEKTVPIHVHGSDGNVGIAGEPDAAFSNETLFVVWRDNYYGPSGNFIIYFKAIPPPDGENLNDVIAISDKTREASAPQIAVSENNVYIIWEDKTNPENSEVFFRASTDGGITFGEIVNLSHSPDDSDYTRLAASDTSVFVLWSDEGIGNGDILLRKSTDNGSSFDGPLNLSNNSGWSASPQIAVQKFTDIAYVVWEDSSPGNIDIFFRTITYSGETVSEEGKIVSPFNMPVIFGIGAAIAGIIAFFAIRSHRTR